MRDFKDYITTKRRMEKQTVSYFSFDWIDTMIILAFVFPFALLALKLM